VGAEWDRSQEEENHTHPGVKARFPLRNQKAQNRKKEVRCNPKSNQLTDILFIFTWGKGCGKGVSVPKLTQQLQLL
jgi:hypothetical protein